MNKKIAAAFVILMISLGTVGYAYATWYKYLFIYGTVNTGTLNVVWSVDDAWDSEIEGKDYSFITGEIDGDYLYVYVGNAYPCIDYYLYINIDNVGTIPAHIYFGPLSENFPGTVEIQGLPGDYVQIHPGESWLGTVHVHLAQEALPGTSYYFNMPVYVVQYNEPDGPGYVPPKQ